jgi:hypothetical protein
VITDLGTSQRLVEEDRETLTHPLLVGGGRINCAFFEVGNPSNGSTPTASLLLYEATQSSINEIKIGCSYYLRFLADLPKWFS